MTKTAAADTIPGMRAALTILALFMAFAWRADASAVKQRADLTKQFDLMCTFKQHAWKYGPHFHWDYPYGPTHSHRGYVVDLNKGEFCEAPSCHGLPTERLAHVDDKMIVFSTGAVHMSMRRKDGRYYFKLYAGGEARVERGWCRKTRFSGFGQAPR